METVIGNGELWMQGFLFFDVVAAKAGEKDGEPFIATQNASRFSPEDKDA
jgi:hypothetical protein